MNVNVDVQLTLMASAFYRILGKRVGRGYEQARARKLFRDFLKAAATVAITRVEIVVKLGRRARNPLLRQASYEDMATAIPWLGNRNLRCVFF
ncbi:MAG: hypothetical protein OXI01_23325 [Albidovulum sp.]|nr:hypothetical protein [Albidovulum sp.]